MPLKTDEEREAYRRKVEEHKERKEEARAAELPRALDTVRVINGLRVSEDITWGVECDLPGYEGLVFHFRTSNPTERWARRPRRSSSPELRALRAQLQAKVLKAELDEAFYEIRDKVDALEAVEEAAFVTATCEWLSFYVKAIDGWNFGTVADYDADDNPVVVPLPAPNPRKPETYRPLVVEHEILGQWAADAGYTKALQEAVRPLSGASETPS